MVFPAEPRPWIFCLRTCACMFLALPPTYVSSASTSPLSLSKLPVCIASRIRCSMNQLDFWVMPRARASSCEEMPFLELATSQIAGSHLSKPNGESSKIDPNFTEYCFLQPLHFHTRRVER